jgi:predicted permease
MFDVLLPVFLLIAVGWAAARFSVVSEAGVQALSDTAFMLFLPALLFRSMARTDFGSFSFTAPVAYFGTGLTLFLVGYFVLRRRGLAVRPAMIYAMSAIFANTVMMGIPLVRLAFGEQGLAVLLTVIGLHSTILLTAATLIVEIGERGGASGEEHGSFGATLAGVVRTTVLHPVILPILAGFAWSLAGLPLSGSIDATLALLGSVAPVLCLILLGASLVSVDPGADVKVALRLTFAKSLLHPAAIYLAGRWIFGLEPLALAVLTVVASLPIGANVFLLSQRYRAGQAPVSAGVAMSTIASAITIAPLLALLGFGTH